MPTYDDLLTLVSSGPSQRPKTDALVLDAMIQGRIDPLDHPYALPFFAGERGLPRPEDLILHIADTILGGHGVTKVYTVDATTVHYVVTPKLFDPTLIYWHNHQGAGWAVQDLGRFLVEKEDEYIRDMETEALALAEYLDTDPLEIKGGAGTYVVDDREYLVMDTEDPERPSFGVIKYCGIKYYVYLQI